MLPEVYSEPCQTSKMEIFAVKHCRKKFLDLWQGSEYASVCRLHDYSFTENGHWAL